MRTYILVFDHSLYIPKLEFNLLCVDQLRDHDITVNDIPLIRLSADRRTPHSHSIVSRADDLHIPLKLDKPISYFHSRKPTQEEIMDDVNHLHVPMTSSVPWELYDTRCNNEEDALRQQLEGDYVLHRLSSVTTNPFHTSCPTALFNDLGDRVCATISGVKSSNKAYLLQPDQLARRWRISLECARRTTAKTSQRALRDWTKCYWIQTFPSDATAVGIPSVAM